SDRNDCLASPLQRLRMRIRAIKPGFTLSALRMLCPATAARTGAPRQVDRLRVGPEYLGTPNSQEAASIIGRPAAPELARVRHRRSRAPPFSRIRLAGACLAPRR